MKKDFLEIVGEIILLIVMIGPMFEFSLLTGIGYLVAIAGSVYNGILFQKKDFARYLVGGTILAYLAGKILPEISSYFKSGDWVSFWIMLVLAVYIWLKGFLLKRGTEI